MLRADGIADLLKTYPNQRFVDTLISIVLYDARVGFQGNSSGHIRRPNHASAFAHPEVITESIQNELQKGRVKQISILSQDLFYSPIDLASKQTNDIQSE